MILPHDACQQLGHVFQETDSHNSFSSLEPSYYEGTSIPKGRFDYFFCTRCGNTVGDFKAERLAAGNGFVRTDGSSGELTFEGGLTAKYKDGLIVSVDFPPDPIPAPDDTCDEPCGECSPMGFSGSINYDNPVTLTFEYGRLTGVTQYPTIRLE